MKMRALLLGQLLWGGHPEASKGLQAIPQARGPIMRDGDHNSRHSEHPSEMI